jgi:hypothetical protein
MPASLLGDTDRSNPKVALRCAEGAGLDGEGANQAILGLAAMRVVIIILAFPENAHRIGSRIASWQPSIRPTVASACLHC